MPRIDSAQSTKDMQPPRQLYSTSPTPLSQGSLGIPTGPVGRINSPQAASNPHTSTALAA